MKTKGKRESKNVETKKTSRAIQAIMREFKNVEIREKPDEFDPLKDKFYGPPPKELEAAANLQKREENSLVSPHLRHRGPIKNKKPHPIDDENNTFKNLSVEADPIRSTKTFRQLEETNKPQKRFSKRTQVTPGGWTVKNF